MLTEQNQNRIELTDEITKILIDNAVKQINEKYSNNYHQQNPHLLSTFIELQKTIYLSTLS